MYITTSLLFISLNNTWEFSIRESHHSQTISMIQPNMSKKTHIMLMLKNSHILDYLLLIIHCVAV